MTVSFSSELSLRQGILATAFSGALVATLGPEGTSSETAVNFLSGLTGVHPLLLDTFDEVLDAVVSGRSDAALVPSAYNGVKKFHWHKDLRLMGFFPLPTPEYGIAAPAHYVPPADRQGIRVASMWQVRRIFHDVAPESLVDQDIDWIDADSTQHAAEIAAAGKADVAVTNLHGMSRHDLKWLKVRPGVDIVWMLFATDPVAP
jgi:hypothetical protein